MNAAQQWASEYMARYAPRCQDVGDEPSSMTRSRHMDLVSQPVDLQNVASALGCRIEEATLPSSDLRGSIAFLKDEEGEEEAHVASISQHYDHHPSNQASVPRKTLHPIRVTTVDELLSRLKVLQKKIATVSTGTDADGIAVVTAAEASAQLIMICNTLLRAALTASLNTATKNLNGYGTGEEVPASASSSRFCWNSDGRCWDTAMAAQHAVTELSRPEYQSEARKRAWGVAAALHKELIIRFDAISARDDNKKKEFVRLFGSSPERVKEDILSFDTSLMFHVKNAYESRSLKHLHVTPICSRSVLYHFTARSARLAEELARPRSDLFTDSKHQAASSSLSMSDEVILLLADVSRLRMCLLYLLRCDLLLHSVRDVHTRVEAAAAATAPVLPQPSPVRSKKGRQNHGKTQKDDTPLHTSKMALLWPLKEHVAAVDCTLEALALRSGNLSASLEPHQYAVRFLRNYRIDVGENCEDGRNRDGSTGSGPAFAEVKCATVQELFLTFQKRVRELQPAGSQGKRIQKSSADTIVDQTMSREEEGERERMDKNQQVDGRSVTSAAPTNGTMSAHEEAILQAVLKGNRGETSKSKNAELTWTFNTSVEPLSHTDRTLGWMMHCTRPSLCVPWPFQLAVKRQQQQQQQPVQGVSSSRLHASGKKNYGEAIMRLHYNSDPLKSFLKAHTESAVGGAAHRSLPSPQDVRHLQECNLFIQKHHRLLAIGEAKCDGSIAPRKLHEMLQRCLKVKMRLR